MMKTTINAHNMSLTDALKEHVDKHVTDLLKTLGDDDAMHLRVTLTHENHHAPAKNACHVVFTQPRYDDVNVTEKDADMYQAITRCGHLARQLVVEAHRKRQR